MPYDAGQSIFTSRNRNGATRLSNHLLDELILKVTICVHISARIKDCEQQRAFSFGVRDSHERANPVIKRNQRTGFRHDSAAHILARESSVERARIDSGYRHHVFGTQRVVGEQLYQRTKHPQRRPWSNPIEVQSGGAPNEDVAFTQANTLDKIILDRTRPANRSSHYFSDRIAAVRILKKKNRFQRIGIVRQQQRSFVGSKDGCAFDLYSGSL